MNIQIIAKQGAPSTKNIGEFLLKNKEYFARSFNFKIMRISSQEESKVLQQYRVKMLPLVIYNRQIVCGESDVKSFLMDLLKPKEMTIADDHDDYLIGTNTFKKINGQIVFDDDCSEPDIKFDKKIMDFDNKRKNLKPKLPTKEEVIQNTIVDERISGDDIEYENFLEEMRSGKY